MVADMNADAGRRYRLYPSAGQAERLTRWGHTCRAVWNVALAQRQFAWSQRRVALRAVDQCRHLTGARTELDWMADLPAQAAQQVLRQLDRAFDNWWNPEGPDAEPQVGRCVAPQARLDPVPPVPAAWRAGPQRDCVPRRARLACRVRGGDWRQARAAERAAGLRGRLRRGLLRIRVDRNEAAPDACHPDPGRAAPLARARAPEGSPDPLGQAPQPGAVLQAGTPHH